MRYRLPYFAMAVALLLAGCPGNGVLDTDDDDDTGDDDTTAAGNFALSFDGTAGGSTESVDAALPNTFTVELWFLATGDGCMVRQKDPELHWSRVWQLGQLDSGDYPGQLAFAYKADTESPYYIGGPELGSLAADEWHHVAVTHDGTDARMWVDGWIAGELLDAPAPQLDSGPIEVGQAGGNEPLTGIVDDLRISTVARYNDEFEPSPTLSADAQTVHLWHFDEGQGETATDDVIGLELHLEAGEWVEVER